MSYVSDNLLPGEQVTFQTRLHKIMFVWPIILSVVYLPLALVTPWVVKGLLLLPFIALWIGTYLSYVSSEFAVTTKRVVIKVGFIKRRTLEMLLPKIEAISVDQSIAGRIWGYGDITVSGTGGTKEPFQRIADPLKFRQAVQAATP